MDIEKSAEQVCECGHLESEHYACATTCILCACKSLKPEPVQGDDAANMRSVWKHYPRAEAVEIPTHKTQWGIIDKARIASAELSDVWPTKSEAWADARRRLTSSASAKSEEKSEASEDLFRKAMRLFWEHTDDSANCPECDGCELPQLCQHCFPKWNAFYEVAMQVRDAAPDASVPAQGDGELHTRIMPCTICGKDLLTCDCEPSASSYDAFCIAAWEADSINNRGLPDKYELSIAKKASTELSAAQNRIRETEVALRKLALSWFEAAAFHCREASHEKQPLLEGTQTGKYAAFERCARELDAALRIYADAKGEVNGGK